MDESKLIYDIVKGGISIVLGFIASFMGGADKILTTLVILVILDFVTGIFEAITNGKLSSSAGFKGLVKKVVIFVLVALSYMIQGVTGDIFPFRETMIMFFIVNESLSILENATKLGVPFPSKLKDILLQLKDDKELKKIEDELNNRKNTK